MSSNDQMDNVLVKTDTTQCDEGQPSCGYCSLRKLNCEYTLDSGSSSSATTPPFSDARSLSKDGRIVLDEDTDFNTPSTPIFNSLIPTLQAASGPMSNLDLELLHHYKTFTWQTLTVRNDDIIVTLHRQSVPQLSLSHSHLLYALLSIAASHSNALVPSKKSEQMALVYRQRTFTEYSRALQNITAENYESVLATGMLLLSLIPPPEEDSADNIAYLVWMDSFLKMSEGLRILASLRWAAGIEKLSVYPLVCRELRALPPPPIFHRTDNRHLHTRVAAVGTTPDCPNPPSTYPLQHSEASPVFLPPPLMDLLTSISNAESYLGPVDMHGNTLYPVLHAFSPIFLSLYYYHLNPDFFVRVFVFCSFLMPEFLRLVKDREPRALVLVAWWFALAGLAPRGWWVGRAVEKVVEAVGAIIMSGNDEVTRRAFEGVDKLIQILQREGSEAAARSVFQGWANVYWDDGPQRAKAWEESLLADWSIDLDCESETFVG